MTKLPSNVMVEKLSPTLSLIPIKEILVGVARMKV